MPAGEGVSSGGWDGVAIASHDTPYIPSGMSVWEMSVREDVNVKADSDYEKRTSLSDGTPTSECTYVSASLRRWTKRGEWAETHTQEGRWKEVRAYGVDDIEAWLEISPATHLWISEQLGLNPHGRRSAISWWAAWSSVTVPVTPHQLVLAGRDQQANDLTNLASGNPQVVTIGGASLQECLAFIAATARDAESKNSNNPIARAIFVDDLGAWRSLLASTKPLFLVPQGESLIADINHSDPHHHIVVPVPLGGDPDITLPSVDTSIAAEALRETGLDEQRSLTVAQLARRSLLSARRSLASKPEMLRPPWAKSPADQVSRGLLLAGSWVGTQSADQEIVSALTAQRYEQLQDRFNEEASGDDPFIAKVGASWFLVSPFDAWLLIGSQINESDLRKFEEVTEKVLTETDPALDRPSAERWTASLTGHVPQHSAVLRSGIASSLAYLGSLGGKINLPGGATGETWATHLVRRILNKANEDTECKIWASLHENLTDLAEGAPDSFLEMTAAGLQGDNPPLSRIFQDAEGESHFFSAASPHTGLLWALESLTWSPDYFGSAVLNLARLVEVDPGGRLHNRPLRSLTSVFHPLIPGKSVDETRRLKVLDRLRKKYPSVSWDLMREILPGPSKSFRLPPRKPELRDWEPKYDTALLDAYRSFIEAIVERMLEDVGSDNSRWTNLFSEYPSLPPEQRSAIRDSLQERIRSGALEGAGKTPLWEEIRSLIARHRHYSDTDWALQEDELIKLEEILQALATDRQIDRHVWLFTNGLPDLGNAARLENYEEYEKCLMGFRKEAIAELDTLGGLSLVQELSDAAESAWSVGWSLASATLGKYDSEVLPSLLSSDEKTKRQGHGFFARRFQQEGWPWLEDLIARTELDAKQKGVLLQLSRSHPRSWEVAEASGEGVFDEYWKAFQINGLGHEFEHIQEAACNLLKVGRFAAALDLIALYLKNQQVEQGIAEVIIEGLDLMLSGAPDPEIRIISSYEIENLLDYLERCVPDVDVATVIRLEWALLPAFTPSLNDSRKATLLHKTLSEDPQFFVRMVEFAHSPASSEEVPSHTDEQVRIAVNAYRLLNEWVTPPGVDPSGQIDANLLEHWISAAREGLETAGRLKVGAGYIGRVLSHLPEGPDGVWPHEDVRDVIEEHLDAATSAGLTAGFLGQRGVVSRSLDEGGKQERELASKYRTFANQLVDEWPKLAASLRSLSEQLDYFARKEDEEAEHHKRGFEK
ncbi:hypothetical protein [Streptomyces chartreusis]|uniref:hypothetical protein n=1 Tax=Streptomyces chartreusis TaxID=1969 RepID=UPI0034022F62